MRLVSLAVIVSLAVGCGPSRNGVTGGDGSTGNGGGAGSGGGGDGGGGGGDQTDGGVADMAGNPMACAEGQRRCAHTFSYAGDGSEQLVEVRGDYRSDGWTKGDAMTASGNTWSVTLPLTWNGTVQYKLHIVLKAGGDKWIPDPSATKTAPDGYGGVNSVLDVGTCSTWTCADGGGGGFTCAGGSTTSSVFDWRDAVIYFTFVDRFFDGNPANDAPITASGLDKAANWQGGDWAGITQKIQAGYFQSLGVNALWISVPMDNSESADVGDDSHLYSGYHGYWPRNLDQPEARFGTKAELTALVAAAHKAGIKVIADYAMNHVHIDSPVWQQHQNDGWFNPLQVNGQNCVCGTSQCPWDSAAKYCWFETYLPDFNFNNADARKFSVDNAMSWIEGYGFDGFRLDAVKHIEVSWLTDLRSRLTNDVESMTHQHVYLVGETFTGDRNLIKSFIDPCAMLDGQFDFPMRAAVDGNVLMRQGKMSDLASFMDGNDGFYGDRSVMSTFIGNHDVPRSIHFAQDTPLWSDVWTDGKDRNWQNQPGVVDGTSAYERVSVALAVLFTNRGAPLLYYGDEVGMPGAGDPDNRHMMQWDGYNAGQKELLGRVQALGAARAAHPALRHGTRTTLSVDDDTWAYQMSDGSDTVWVVINRGDSARTVGGLPAHGFKDRLTGDMLTGPQIMVPPRSARVLE